ncbi:MAG: T9SS type A sorting domain-containing protein [Bacteroidota bacterium]
MTYLKNIFLFLLLLSGINTDCQIIGTNLVQNPSFEKYYNCPTWAAQLYECKYWWGYSTDYFNACAASGGASVPLNGFGFQYAHTGVAYSGCVINGDHNAREIIRTKLSDILIANKRYCTNFYITLSEYTYTWIPNAYVVIDSIGMFFSKDSVQDTLPLPILSSGIKVQNNIFNIDTINWLKISNTFITNGGEQYLMIGNFDNLIIYYPSGTLGRTYVYVDDVSVCECSFKFSLGNDTTLCVGESLILKPNMPNAIYTWQDSSHTSTYKVTQAGTYWVSAYFAEYNFTTYDTINIAYINCDTIDTINNIISIYPNPATNNLTIETNFNEEHRLEIINLLGQTIYTTYIGRKSIINTSNYSCGLYILKIYTDKEIVVRKFVKE